MCWENVFSEKTSTAAEKSYGAVITFQRNIFCKNEVGWQKDYEEN